MIRILLILGLAFADKLDRTYLPPVGSEFSGGNPDALEVPFEQPKLQYPSKDALKSPEIAIGIDRVGPKGSLDVFSTINPSVYPENTFVTPATYVPTKNVYSSTNPVDHSSQDYHDIQSSFKPKNLYQNNQPRYDSVSIDNQFQTTENYPQLIQGIVNPKDNSYGPLPNQIKSQGERINSINVDNSKPSLTSDLLTNSFPNKYDSGKNSTLRISPTQTNDNFRSSSLFPSNDYFYSSTAKPEQAYFSTPATPDLITTAPISYTSSNSPLFQIGYEKRPERVQAQADREASILNYENSITPNGYYYSFDNSNGIHGDESGIIRDGVKAKGSYSYIGDDGKLYSVKYTADENGFQPQGDHLPTSPPIPDAILKVIEQVTKEKEAGIFDDGSCDENKYGYRNYHNGLNHPKTGFSTGNTYKNIEKDQKTYNSNKKPIAALDDNNYENISVFVPLEPNHSNQLYNKSKIEQIGNVDATDLVIGDEETNRSPNFYQRPVYKNSASSNKRNQIIANNAGQNRLNEDTTKDAEESGYYYNPPQNRGLKKFSSRFSDIYDMKNERPIQDKNIKMIPKPFLTPYASQTKDVVQNYGNYEKPSKNTGEYYEGEIPQNNYNDDRDRYSIYAEDNLDGKDSTQPDERIFRINYQNKETKFNDYEPDKAKEGYSYQKGIIGSNDKSYDSFVSTSPKGYASSTVIPNEFTTRTSIPSRPEYSGGETQTVTRENTMSTSTTAPNLYQENIQLYETDRRPLDYTRRPGLIDQSVRRTEQNVALPDYPKDFNTTTPRSSTNIPTIGNSFAPSIDIVTDKSIKEKYVGPNQPQRFDPNTGYYY